MITKTGANYQSEGGYIEASIENGVVTINDNKETIGEYYHGYKNVSFVPVVIKVDSSLTSLTFYGVEKYANDEFLFDYSTIQSGGRQTFYVTKNSGMRVNGSNLKVDYEGAVIKTVAGVACLFFNTIPEPGTIVTVSSEV